MSASSYINSIPTPPISPRRQHCLDHEMENPLKSTVNLLDSLVAFYQHERMWVCRARAVLEETFQEPPAITPTLRASESQGNISSSSTESPPSSEISPSENSTDHKPLRPGQMPSRWMRRKKGFKLRLEGIKPRRFKKRNHQSHDAKEHILEMFEKMVEERMESCQRLSKLIRNTDHHAYIRY